jgi:propanol-preferring alcohol dehydrogenase
VIDGEIRVLPRMPLTLGHENAGRIAAVGAGVQTVKDGDPVAVYGGWGCGVCDLCVAGHEQLCEKPQWAGLSDHDGGYAEYLLVPHERYLVKLHRLKPAEAAPLTDAALTPYRAIRKALPFLAADHPVLLIGVGGLGQYGLKLLRLRGRALFRAGGGVRRRVIRVRRPRHPPHDAAAVVKGCCQSSCLRGQDDVQC